MDIEYLLFLQKIREAAGPLLEYIFYTFTMLAVGGIAISFFIYYCVDKKRGYHAAASFIVGNLFVQTLKNIFCINRPWIRDSRVHPSRLGIKGATGYSFPSGHSNAAASSYGSLAYQYRKKKKLCIGLIVLILLAGFSRNYLGVHSPQDVLIGLVCGCGAVFAVESYMSWFEKKPHHTERLILAALLLSVGLSLFTILKNYPAVYVNGKLAVDPIKMQRDALQGYGMFAGFVIGSVLERKYVCFQTKGLKCREKCMRIIIGVAGVGLFYFLFHNLLIHIMDGRLCYYIMGFCMMWSAVYLAPLVFTKMEEHNRNS